MRNSLVSCASFGRAAFSRINRHAPALLVAAVVLADVAPAFATSTDPTYTSQIGPMLSQVNMTALNTDLASWGGVAIAIFLTLAGIALVRKLLHKVMGG